MALESTDLFIVQRNQQSYKMPASEILGIIPPAATVGDGLITIVQPGTSNQTFTVNQSGPSTITLKDTTYTMTTLPSGTGIRLQDSSGTNNDVTLTAGSNVSISRDSNQALTISATNTNTTYTAGNGISLSGTEFSVSGGTGLNQDAGGLSLAAISGNSVLGNTGAGSAVPTAVQVDGQMIVDSVGLAGSPTTTTQDSTTNNTTIATTEFVKNVVASEGVQVLQLLLIAGGGGGGCQAGAGVGPGGGGAGGVILETEFLTAGATFNFTVGAGGSGKNSGNPSGDNGSNSTFGGYVAIGGGGGGGEGSSGLAGGSGGGGSGNGERPGGSGTSGQGNNGGNGAGNNGGGGGGAGEAPPAANGSVAGDGGDGILSNITGTPTYYGGGGAGGRWQTGDVEGNPGLGGGGRSATNTEDAEDGVDGLGGGGGAGRGNWGGPSIRSGNGGNGAVIIRYPSSFTPTYTGGSPVRSTVGNDTVDIISFSGSVSF